MTSLLNLLYLRYVKFLRLHVNGPPNRTGTFRDPCFTDAAARQDQAPRADSWPSERGRLLASRRQRRRRPRRISVRSRRPRRGLAKPVGRRRNGHRISGGGTGVQGQKAADTEAMTAAAALAAVAAWAAAAARPAMTAAAAKAASAAEAAVAASAGVLGPVRGRRGGCLSRGGAGCE